MEISANDLFYFDWQPRISTGGFGWPLKTTLTAGESPEDLTDDGINSITGMNQLIAAYNRRIQISNNGKTLSNYVGKNLPGTIDNAFIGNLHRSVKVTSASVLAQRRSLSLGTIGSILPSFLGRDAQKTDEDITFPVGTIGGHGSVRDNGDDTYTIIRSAESFTVFSDCTLAVSVNSGGAQTPIDFWLDNGAFLSYTPSGSFLGSLSPTGSVIILAKLTSGSYTLFGLATGDEAAAASQQPLTGNIWQLFIV